MKNWDIELTGLVILTIIAIALWATTVYWGCRLLDFNWRTIGGVVLLSSQSTIISRTKK